MERYSVLLNNADVGIVQIERQGLYYSIVCRCAPISQGIYKLIVTNGEDRIDLGILTPKDGFFVVNKRIPIKNLGAGELSFYIVAHSDNVSRSGCFVPVEIDKPFPRLQDIDRARFTCVNGVPGLLIP